MWCCTSTWSMERPYHGHSALKPFLHSIAASFEGSHPDGLPLDQNKVPSHGVRSSLRSSTAEFQRLPSLDM
jgi:hypothetical protein